MKYIIGVLFLCAVSVSLVAQVQLKNRVDSINYAYGYANGDGMKQYVIDKDSTDERRVEKFVDGLVFAFGDLTAEDSVRVNALFMCFSMSTYTSNGVLFGDVTLPHKEKLFNKHFIKALKGERGEVSENDASMYVQATMSTPLDSGVVRSKEQVDSLNVAVAVLNGIGARKNVLMADTTKKDVKLFLKEYAKARKVMKKNKLYVEGVRVGKSMKEQIVADKYLMGDENVPLDVDIIKAGILASITNDVNSLMPDSIVEEYLNSYMSSKADKEMAQRIKVNAEFLEQNSKSEGVVVTESGLQYFVNKMGDGEKPKAHSVVKVHYEGRLIDGTMFDSSKERGEPIQFSLQGVIKGWTEGLQLMPVGSKFTFFVPFHLGYGENGAGGVIPPFATLIFEVELLEIVYKGTSEDSSN